MSTQVYTNRQGLNPRSLSEDHARMLFKESGIAPEVAAERGYWTIVKRSEFPPGFGKNKRRVPALGIPVYSPDGSTSFVRVRHGKPRPTYKLKKGRWVRNGETRYDQPSGQKIIIDVHPRNTERVKDVGADLWITEGEKKADALTSRGLCAVALFGVDCWGKGGELLSDWQHVALNGRTVYVVYDSDVMTKPEVQRALERLVGALQARGAVVRVVYLPDAPDGGKQGVDDYLVAGGAVGALYKLSRPFEKSESTELRLSRNERLRAAMEAQWRKHDAIPTRTEKQCIRRAVLRAHIEALVDRGKTDKAGKVSYYLAAGEGAIGANVSQPTFTRHTRDLEEEGVFKIQEPNDPSDANLYVVGYGNHSEGTLGQREESGCLRGKENVPSGLSSHRDSHTPQGELPEFRHSRVIVSWRMDDLGRRVCETDPLLRLGFRRREVLVYLLAHGPTNKETLIGLFASEKAKWRDFKRDLLRPMIEDFPIVEVEGDVVSLRRDWRVGVEKARGHGQEEEDLTQQRVNYELKKAAFRNKDSVKPDPEPEMRPADDMRQPWSHHPEKCACRECSKRFGRVVGAHVDDCRCGPCARDRREQARKRKRPTPRLVPLASKSVAQPVESDDWLNHPLACECVECTSPVTRYVRLREVAA